MRRLLAVAISGMLAAALLTGCGGRPAGVDGDLTDDWSAPAAPKSFVPQVDVCHPTAEQISYLSSYHPVDCAGGHGAETVHVGSFTGPDAERTSPPPAGSPALRSAFGECDARAQRFVGGDWRGGQLSVVVVSPSPQGWTGGSRWYRCDLVQSASLEVWTVQTGVQWLKRTGSLRGALAKPSPLAYTCFNEASVGGGFQPVGCGQPHRYEYAGIWTSPDMPFEKIDLKGDSIHGRCRAVIARYVKVPASVDMRFRTGTAFRTPSEEAWGRGDRGIRCFLYSDNRELTRSLRGAGPGALPAR
ncbi:MAG TPA: septum formation family protein [Catenuloplanes sp.]|jgi:hypothetical protein